jgi:hypothetical protein
MALSPQDFDRMQWLLGKSLLEGIRVDEESELRKYISQEFPEAMQLPSKILINLGLIYVGMTLLVKRWG